MLNSGWKKSLGIIHRLEDSLLVLLVLTLIGLASTQIILRNFSDVGLVWAESALRVLVLWIALFGAMRASRDGEHIAIDILQRYFKSKWQLLFTWAALTFSGAVCLIAAYYGWEFVQLEREDGSRTFLNIPVWFCESIIPFSLLIIGLRFFIHSIAVVVNGER